MPPICCVSFVAVIRGFAVRISVVNDSPVSRSVVVTSPKNPKLSCLNENVHIISDSIQASFTNLLTISGVK